MSFHWSNRGFTLVEVVVVVGIIVLLGTAVLASVQEGRKKSYDTQRVSDLEQIQLAFRTYRDEYSTSTYPGYPTGDLIGDGAGIDTVIGEYVTGQMQDPINAGVNRYYYDSSYECNSVDRVVLIAQTMGRSGAANYTETCGVVAEDIGNGVTPTENSYILILK